MNKISIIIQREYLTRIKKKSFIIMTLLTPVLLAALILIPVWLAGIKDGEIKNIAVIDHTGKYAPAFVSNETYRFNIVSEPMSYVKADGGYYALILISDNLANNPNAVSIYAENQVGLEFKSYVTSLLTNFVEDEKLAQHNIPGLKEIIAASKTTINVRTIKWSDDGTETETSSEMALIIGMIAAFLIYTFILAYGAQLMRGVVEEKTNRIVEIIISSVKPFELMMGKIIGIALVGLTQFMIWIILVVSIFAFMGNGLHGISEAQDIIATNEPTANPIINALLNCNFVEIGIFFLIYFLSGYLLYASLFAAIGAASDNETDTQQFMIPVMIPVMFALYAAIYSATNPDGPLAFWASMIPFTSPIVMLVRIPLGVPAWELVLSVAILISSFIICTWLASKIYRTGILMYGKKVNYKEIWKWIKYK